jgi:hypothetical protein
MHSGSRRVFVQEGDIAISPIIAGAFLSNVNKTPLLGTGTIQLLNDLTSQNRGAQIVSDQIWLGGFHTSPVTIAEIIKISSCPASAASSSGCVVRVLTAGIT